MAALEIHGNGDSGSQITEDVINKTIDSLENQPQKVNKYFYLSNYKY